MGVVGPRYGATCLRPEAVKWEEALEPDDRDPRILGEGPCNQIHVSKAKYDQNQFGVWLSCRTCAVRLHYAPKKGAPQNTISPGPTPEVVRAVIGVLWNTPADQVDSNLFRGMIKIEQGRRQVARAAAKSRAFPEKVPSAVPLTPRTLAEHTEMMRAHQDLLGKARSKAPPTARPSSAPVYDLSSPEAQPKEDTDSPTLDRWNILLRRLLRRQAEIEEMMEM